MSKLEEIISRTTIDVPGQSHLETEDFKWLILRCEKLEGALKYLEHNLDQKNFSKQKYLEYRIDFLAIVMVALSEDETKADAC